MDEHDKTSTGKAPGEARPSPATDPTNPFHQEATGQFVPAELGTERRVDEPGLTDADRVERGI
jgi:hypothetical protein